MNCDSMIDSLYTGLNEEQKLSVSASPDRHMLILAGAGCGKTTVLTRRIAYLTLQGVKQDRILALTFTRKAAEEMDARVKLLDGINKEEPLPLITTFHGFSLKVLSECMEGRANFERIGFTGERSLISERERLELLAKVSTTEERSILQADIFKLDSLLAQKDVFPEKLSALNPQQHEILSCIENRLRVEKHKIGKWDFSDLLSGIMYLFEQYPQICSIYSSRFDSILVDEFQDTNPMQIKLLHKLLISGSHLFAVGDDDQAIYGFRGADIRPTIDFCNYFTGAAIQKLQINYRSVPSILNTANHLFENKALQYRKVLVSGRYDYSGVKPSAHVFDDQHSMISWVAKKAQTISAETLIPIGKMVMLFRVNQSLEWTKKLVEQKFSVIGEMQFLTVHRSKGLEFPVVFLCDLEEGVFPSYKVPPRKKIDSVLELLKYLIKPHRVKIDCDWDEEKRLFYVGITRAEKYLYFISLRSKIVYGRARKMPVSRLLKLI